MVHLQLKYSEHIHFLIILYMENTKPEMFSPSVQILFEVLFKIQLSKSFQNITQNEQMTTFSVLQKEHLSSVFKNLER